MSNPFENNKDVGASEKVEVPEKVQEENNSNKQGRKVIDENTLEDNNWIILPKEKEIDNITPSLKINTDGYYNQEGKEYVNKTTNKPFYSGLKDQDGNKVGEFILEGKVDGNLAKVRLSNWELVYKMNSLVRHCRSNNFTLANQEVAFKRVNSGRENAGKNWELHVPSLKIKFVGPDNQVQDLS